MKAKSELNLFLLAGLTGGMAEVLWTWFYTAFSATSFNELGSAITATVLGSSANLSLAPILGLAIHLGLSLLLSLAFGYILWPLIKRYTNKQSMTLVVSIISLALVWKINFYVLLPIWNPQFITLLPLSVTLISKLLFGVGMGSVLMMARRPIAI